MDLTYLSIITFIIITMVYYAIPSIGKVSVTIKALSSIEEMTLFKQESNTRLAIYLAVVILSQFIINTSFVINACGGSSVSNYGSAFLITFLPWIFIFGIMLVTLIMYPGFKGAFADIVGYFFVADKANDALSNILISDSVTQGAINSVEDANVKSDLVKAAESVSKMLGNKAIIINQITPLNFNDMWNTLKQLMKPNMFENEEAKSGLLDIAVMRDSIGEAMWYVYTGILIISYTSYKITSATCPPDVNKLIKRNIRKVEETVTNKAVKPATAAVAGAAAKGAAKIKDKKQDIKKTSNEVKPASSALKNAASSAESIKPTSAKQVTKPVASAAKTAAKPVASAAKTAAKK